MTLMAKTTRPKSSLGEAGHTLSCFKRACDGTQTRKPGDKGLLWVLDNLTVPVLALDPDAGSEGARSPGFRV